MIHMSGHSKWSKVKHQKESSDAVKGKIFTKLANGIIIAVREGGGSSDPNVNFRLRLAIERAKNFNMPKENIERAIKKVSGTNAANMRQPIIYEAFGPGGVGIIITAATNNKARLVSELKNTLERRGGSLARSGAVLHLFSLVGLISVAKDKKTYDEIMEAALNVGAVDLKDTKDSVEVYAESSDLHSVKDHLISLGLIVLSYELFYRPITTIPIEDRHKSQEILKLVSDIEDMPDVQRVYANFDIADEYLKI